MKINLKIKPQIDKSLEYPYHDRLFKLGKNHPHYNPDSTAKFIFIKTNRFQEYAMLGYNHFSEKHIKVVIVSQAKLEQTLREGYWEWV